MMPWNPIHRYAGVQSSIDPIASDPVSTGPLNGVTSDPFGNDAYRDVDVSFGHASGSGEAGFVDATRRPLGFIDVRSEFHADRPVSESSKPDADSTADADTEGGPA